MKTLEKEKREEDGFLRGFSGMPDDVTLSDMSFTELAILLSSCEGGSAKFKVVERELKKYLAKDQAEINRKNTILSTCLGGFFGLSGVILGAQLENFPSCHEMAPIAAIQQPSNGGVAPNQSFAIPLTSNTAVAQSDGQPLNRAPKTSKD